MTTKTPSVFALSKPSRCYNCDQKLEVDELVQLKKDEDEKEVLCIRCAGLDALKVLRPGNAAVTRLAKKYSKHTFVIWKWSELWKCYERQGLLLEADAIERAKAEAK